MKKLFLCVLIVAAAFSVTCSYPIFYAISLEEKILEPKIKGSPTNFAVLQGHLYVASGETLYRYNGTVPDYTDRGLWDEIKPGGKIFELTAISGNLFIICEESGKNVLKRSENGNNWFVLDVKIGDDVYNIRSIHSAGDHLFFGAGEIGSLCILTCDNNGNNFQKLANTENKLLNGAAFNGKYYLIAKDLISDIGGRIYSSDISLGGLEEGTDNNPYVGIINLNNDIVLTIAQDGKLYNIAEPSTRIANLGNNYSATGAFAIWENEIGGNNLLLVGRQNKLNSSVDSGYTYGYLEIIITGSGLLGELFNEPGKISPSTLSDNEKYTSTIGKYPITDIIQSPEINGERIIFASTQKNGVWSYRLRNGSWSWNAEQ